MAVILAPCGRAGAAEKLLEAGADGLYVGLRGLSHGSRSSELTLEELEDLCRRAHRRGAQVLLSLNLVPLVAEERAWRAVADSTVEAGVDGIILQDPGLTWVLSRRYPGVALHVSVGAVVLNGQDARFWREAGARVVVLQPGTLPEEASAIRKTGGLEVELFVSGRTCQATLLGRCGMGNYLKQTWKRTELRRAVPEGSRKRSGVCYYVCEGSWSSAQGPLGPWGPVAIEHPAPLEDYLAAGVRYLKVGGRSRPPEEVVEEVKALRRALAESERIGIDAVSGYSRA